MPSTTTVVSTIPVCDLCNAPGYADCRVPSLKTWANVCKRCFKAYNCGLGLGVGQVFELRPIIPMATLPSAAALEPARLAPLGATDMYSYRNGVLVSYGDGFMRFYASCETPPITIPAKSWPVIVAVAKVLGLSDEEGNLLAEAAEAYA